MKQTARRALEASRVAPYLWASCPEKLTSQKQAYLDLLRVLQLRSEYVDSELHGKSLRLVDASFRFYLLNFSTAAFRQTSNASNASDVPILHLQKRCRTSTSVTPH